MSFAIDFVIEFFSFRVDPKSNKYFPNTFDPILLMRHNKTLGLEIKSEDEEDIKNPDPCFPLFKKGLQRLLFIFNRHNS